MGINESFLEKEASSFEAASGKDTLELWNSLEKVEPDWKYPSVFFDLSGFNKDLIFKKNDAEFIKCIGWANKNEFRAFILGEDAIAAVKNSSLYMCHSGYDMRLLVIFTKEQNDGSLKRELWYLSDGAKSFSSHGQFIEVDCNTYLVKKLNGKTLF